MDTDKQETNSNTNQICRYITTNDAIQKMTMYINKYSIDGNISIEIVDILKYELQKYKQSKHKTVVHATVPLTYRDQIVYVDRNISNLMRCLSICNIDTRNSSENDKPNDYIRIEFTDYIDLMRFKEILFLGIDNLCDIKHRALDDCYYHHIAWQWNIICQYDRHYHKNSNSILQNNLSADDTRVCVYCQSSKKPSDYMIIGINHYFSVRFPEKDYKWVLNKFETYIAQHNSDIPENSSVDFHEKMFENKGNFNVVCNKLINHSDDDDSNDSDFEITTTILTRSELINTNNAIEQITKFIRKYSVDGIVDVKILSVLKYELKIDHARKKEYLYPTVQMRNLDGEIVEVDKNISKLIKCLWLCNIETSDSWENGLPGNYVGIEFDRFIDLARFKEILFLGVNESDDIKIRALDRQYYDNNSWKWEMDCDADIHHHKQNRNVPLDDPFVDDEERICSQCSLDIEKPESIIVDIYHSFVVRFPQRDYEWVLGIFQLYVIQYNGIVPDDPCEEFIEKLHFHTRGNTAPKSKSNIIDI